jgi:hypothetical protein
MLIDFLVDTYERYLHTHCPGQVVDEFLELVQHLQSAAQYTVDPDEVDADDETMDESVGEDEAESEDADGAEEDDAEDADAAEDDDNHDHDDDASDHGHHLGGEDGDGHHTDENVATTSSTTSATTPDHTHSSTTTAPDHTHSSTTTHPHTHSSTTSATSTTHTHSSTTTEWVHTHSSTTLADHTHSSTTTAAPTTEAPVTEPHATEAPDQLCFLMDYVHHWEEHFLLQVYEADDVAGLLEAFEVIHDLLEDDHELCKIRHIVHTSFLDCDLTIIPNGLGLVGLIEHLRDSVNVHLEQACSSAGISDFNNGIDAMLPFVHSTTSPITTTTQPGPVCWLSEFVAAWKGHFMMHVWQADNVHGALDAFQVVDDLLAHDYDTCTMRHIGDVSNIDCALLDIDPEQDLIGFTDLLHTVVNQQFSQHHCSEEGIQAFNEAMGQLLRFINEPNPQCYLMDFVNIWGNQFMLEVHAADNEEGAVHAWEVIRHLLLHDQQTCLMRHIGFTSLLECNLLNLSPSLGLDSLVNELDVLVNQHFSAHECSELALSALNEGLALLRENIHAPDSVCTVMDFMNNLTPQFLKEVHSAENEEWATAEFNGIYELLSQFSDTCAMRHVGHSSVMQCSEAAVEADLPLTEYLDILSDTINSHMEGEHCTTEGLAAFNDKMDALTEAVTVAEPQCDVAAFVAHYEAHFNTLIHHADHVEETHTHFDAIKALLLDHENTCNCDGVNNCVVRHLGDTNELDCALTSVHKDDLDEFVDFLETSMVEHLEFNHCDPAGVQAIKDKIAEMRDTINDPAPKCPLNDFIVNFEEKFNAAVHAAGDVHSTIHAYQNVYNLLHHDFDTCHMRHITDTANILCEKTIVADGTLDELVDQLDDTINEHFVNNDCSEAGLTAFNDAVDVMREHIAHPGMCQLMDFVNHWKNHFFLEIHHADHQHTAIHLVEAISADLEDVTNTCSAGRHMGDLETIECAATTFEPGKTLDELIDHIESVINAHFADNHCSEDAVTKFNSDLDGLRDAVTDPSPCKFSEYFAEWSEGWKQKSNLHAGHAERLSNWHVLDHMLSHPDETCGLDNRHMNDALESISCELVNLGLTEWVNQYVDHLSNVIDVHFDEGHHCSESGLAAIRALVDSLYYVDHDDDCTLYDYIHHWEVHFLTKVWQAHNVDGAMVQHEIIHQMLLSSNDLCNMRHIGETTMIACEKTVFDETADASGLVDSLAATINEHFSTNHCTMAGRDAFNDAIDVLKMHINEDNPVCLLSDFVSHWENHFNLVAHHAHNEAGAVAAVHAITHLLDEDTDLCNLRHIGDFSEIDCADAVFAPGKSVGELATLLSDTITAHLADSHCSLMGKGAFADAIALLVHHIENDAEEEEEEDAPEEEDPPIPGDCTLYDYIHHWEVHFLTKVYQAYNVEEAMVQHEVIHQMLLMSNDLCNMRHIGETTMIACADTVFDETADAIGLVDSLQATINDHLSGSHCTQEGQDAFNAAIDVLKMHINGPEECTLYDYIHHWEVHFLTKVHQAHDHDGAMIQHEHIHQMLLMSNELCDMRHIGETTIIACEDTVFDETADAIGLVDSLQATINAHLSDSHCTSLGQGVFNDAIDILKMHINGPAVCHLGDFVQHWENHFNLVAHHAHNQAGALAAVHSITHLLAQDFDLCNLRHIGDFSEIDCSLAAFAPGKSIDELATLLSDTINAHLDDSHCSPAGKGAFADAMDLLVMNIQDPNPECHLADFVHDWGHQFELVSHHAGNEPAAQADVAAINALLASDEDTCKMRHIGDTSVIDCALSVVAPNQDINDLVNQLESTINTHFADAHCEPGGMGALQDLFNSLREHVNVDHHHEDGVCNLSGYIHHWEETFLTLIHTANSPHGAQMSFEVIHDMLLAESDTCNMRHIGDISEIDCGALEFDHDETSLDILIAALSVTINNHLMNNHCNSAGIAAFNQAVDTLIMHVHSVNPTCHLDDYVSHWKNHFLLELHHADNQDGAVAAFEAIEHLLDHDFDTCTMRHIGQISEMECHLTAFAPGKSLDELIDHFTNTINTHFDMNHCTSAGIATINDAIQVLLLNVHEPDPECHLNDFMSHWKNHFELEAHHADHEAGALAVVDDIVALFTDAHTAEHTCTMRHLGGVSVIDCAKTVFAPGKSLGDLVDLLSQTILQHFNENHCTAESMMNFNGLIEALRLEIHAPECHLSDYIEHWGTHFATVSHHADDPAAAVHAFEHLAAVMADAHTCARHQGTPALIDCEKTHFDEGKNIHQLVAHLEQTVLEHLDESHCSADGIQAFEDELAELKEAVHSATCPLSDFVGNWEHAFFHALDGHANEATALDMYTAIEHLLEHDMDTCQMRHIVDTNELDCADTVVDDSLSLNQLMDLLESTVLTLFEGNHCTQHGIDTFKATMDELREAVNNPQECSMNDYVDHWQNHFNMKVHEAADIEQANALVASLVHLLDHDHETCHMRHIGDTSTVDCSRLHIPNLNINELIQHFETTILAAFENAHCSEAGVAAIQETIDALSDAVNNHECVLMDFVDFWKTMFNLQLHHADNPIGASQEFEVLYELLQNDEETCKMRHIVDTSKMDCADTVFSTGKTIDELVDHLKLTLIQHLQGSHCTDHGVQHILEAVDDVRDQVRTTEAPTAPPPTEPAVCWLEDMMDAVSARWTIIHKDAFAWQQAGVSFNFIKLIVKQFARDPHKYCETRHISPNQQVSISCDFKDDVPILDVCGLVEYVDQHASHLFEEFGCSHHTATNFANGIDQWMLATGCNNPTNEPITTKFIQETCELKDRWNSPFCKNTGCNWQDNRAVNWIASAAKKYNKFRPNGVNVEDVKAKVKEISRQHLNTMYDSDFVPYGQGGRYSEGQQFRDTNVCHTAALTNRNCLWFEMAGQQLETQVQLHFHIVDDVFPYECYEQGNFDNCDGAICNAEFGRQIYAALENLAEATGIDFGAEYDERGGLLYTPPAQ